VFYEGNCGDLSLISDIFHHHDIGTIIHFAGSISVAESVTEPISYYTNNAMNSLNLIEQAIRYGVTQFVFSSSAAVYGEPRQVPITEDQNKDPINPYGRSKLFVEWLLQDAAKSNRFRYCTLRYFNVAGADRLGRTGESGAVATHLIKVAAQAALGLRPRLDVYGSDYPTADGTCIRDYVHVCDLAQAHVSAVRYLRGGGAALECNVGYGRGYSVREVVDVVKRVSGTNFEVRMCARRDGDPAVLVASNQRAKAMLGWSYQHDRLDDIVGDALGWEKKLQKSGAIFPSLAEVGVSASPLGFATPIIPG
jgi:UDP-glucose 4-epimerase